MAYFGLIYNTPAFKYDVRIVYVIPGLAFGWVVFFIPYLENRFGRYLEKNMPLKFYSHMHKINIYNQ